MKLPTKIASFVATVATVVGLSASAVFAAAPGQVSGGNANYEIKNVTTGSAYANPQTAKACDVVQYRLTLYNPAPSDLADVKVEAGINTVTPYTSAVSSATAYAPDGRPTQTGFQATLNISTAQTQKYEAGSTQLLNSDGDVMRSLPDGITRGAGGISIGALGESVTEYVTFKTKINCPTPPEQPKTPKYSCDAFDIKATDGRKVTVTKFSQSASDGAVFKDAVVNWGDSSSAAATANVIGQTHTYKADGTYTVSVTANFTVDGTVVSNTGPQCQAVVTFKPNQPPVVTPPTPTTPPQTPSTTAPTTLVNTGPGSVLAIVAAVAAVSAFGYRFVLGRKLAR